MRLNPTGFITERRQHFLIAEEPLAGIVDHQDRLAAPEPEGWCFAVRCGRGNAGQPNLETAADARCASDVHCAGMLPHNLTHGREPQAIAV